MPEAYEFFDHTADIGVHIYGVTLEDLFRNAALALSQAIGELQKTEIRKQRTLELQTGSLEDLLHDWLAELLYEVEVHHILYNDIEFTKLTSGCLVAKLGGTSIDFSRSNANEEIKAVTYHQLRVEPQPDGSWRATVILDV